MRLRSDQESSVRAFAQEAAARRSPAVTIVETTPRGSSSLLGSGERLIQSITGQVRALRLETEKRWNTRFTTTSPLMAWAVLHAAWLHNRHQPVRGRTLFEAVQGHRYGGVIYNFAEAVMVREADLAGVPKMDPRWSMGVWMGRTSDSDEQNVGTPRGVKYARSVKPIVEGVPRMLCDEMTWAPWGEPRAAKPAKEMTATARSTGPSATSSVPSSSMPPCEAGAAYARPVQHHPERRQPKQKRTVELERFWEECGRTPGCAQCVKPGGGGHTT